MANTPKYSKEKSQGTRSTDVLLFNLLESFFLSFYQLYAFPLFPKPRFLLNKQLHISAVIFVSKDRRHKSVHPVSVLQLRNSLYTLSLF